MLLTHRTNLRRTNAAWDRVWDGEGDTQFNCCLSLSRYTNTLPADVYCGITVDTWCLSQQRVKQESRKKAIKSKVRETSHQWGKEKSYKTGSDCPKICLTLVCIMWLTWSWVIHIFVHKSYCCCILKRQSNSVKKQKNDWCDWCWVVVFCAYCAFFAPDPPSRADCFALACWSLEPNRLAQRTKPWHWETKLCSCDCIWGRNKQRNNYWPALHFPDTLVSLSFSQ